MTARPTQEALLNAAAAAFQKPFGAVVKLAPEGGAPIWVDGRANPPAILSAAPDAEHSVWSAAGDTLIRALANSRTFEGAYVSGRINVAGDMSAPARIILGGKS